MTGKLQSVPGVLWILLVVTVACDEGIAESHAGPGGMVASVQSSSETIDIAVGETVALESRLRTGSGKRRTGQSVKWESIDPSIASVSRNGEVIGVSVGSTRVIASAGKASDTWHVTVYSRGELSITPAGATLNYIGAELGLSAGGAVVDSGSGVSWTSLEPSVAIVDSLGRVTAQAVGSALIVATAACCGAADTAGVNVRQLIASVSISPAAASVEPGKTVRLKAAVADSGGTPVAGASIAWASSDAEVAVVASDGLVSGFSAGNAIITATAGGKTGSAEVTVIAAGDAEPPTTPAGLNVRPFSASAVDLSWQPSTDNVGVSGYRIYRDGRQVATSDGTAYTDEELQPSTTYVYAVAAFDAAGNVSPLSAMSSATTAPLDPTYPNQPAGFTRWLEHDFNTLPSGALSGAGFASVSYGDTYTTVNESSRPVGSGPVLRIRFPKGMSDGVSPGRFFGWDTNSSATSTALKEWYVSLWIKLEGADWEWPPNEQKLWYNGVGQRGYANWGGPVSFKSLGTRTIGSGVRMRLSTTPCPGCVVDVWEQPESNAVRVQNGQWVHLEAYGKLSDPDKRNGIRRIWVNGALVLSTSTVLDQSTTNGDWTTGFSEFHWAPVWGGYCGEVRCPKTRDDYMRIAHLYISGIRQ
jgi:uncharacterized protein YjdB